MSLCIRGLHEWSNEADAAKCCNGWRREFDIPEGAAVIPENPRRVWVRCEHQKAARIEDGKVVVWCVRCGTTLE